MFSRVARPDEGLDLGAEAAPPLRPGRRRRIHQPAHSLERQCPRNRRNVRLFRACRKSEKKNRCFGRLKAFFEEKPTPKSRLERGCGRAVAARGRKGGPAEGAPAIFSNFCLTSKSGGKPRRNGVWRASYARLSPGGRRPIYKMAIDGLGLGAYNPAQERGRHRCQRTENSSSSFVIWVVDWLSEDD